MAGERPGRNLILLGIALLTLAPGCSPTARAGDPPTDTLTIGAYSVVREAFREGLLPAFREHWKSTTGRGLTFEESYNASGAQSRAIASGFDADVAVLSLEGDITRLVKAGLVRKDWQSGPNRGIVSRSLVVIGVRAGNPHRIKDWIDLARPDVDVLYPDPKTSGGARWNINAIYGAGLLGDGLKGTKPNREAARNLLARVQARVVNMDASGRQSVATFERGTGDAIVTYENELLLLRKKNRVDFPYVIPPATLRIESPAVIVEESVRRHGNRKVAAAFLDFVRSAEGQRILSDFGFRPLGSAPDTDSTHAPLPPRLFTMADLGGWSKVNKDVYDPGGVWDSLFTGSGRGK